MSGCFRESAQPDLGMLPGPCAEWGIAHAIRLAARQGFGDIPCADHDIMPQLGKLAAESLPDYACAKNSDLHG